MFLAIRPESPKRRGRGTELAQMATRKQKAQRLLGLMSLIYKENSGRGERIRTSGLYVPNVALYQAKLHPDASSQISCVSGLTLQRESTQVYQRLTEKGRG